MRATKALAVERLSGAITGVPIHKSTTWLKLLLLLAVILGAIVASRFVSRDQVFAVMDRARNVGWVGYLVLICAYGVWCAFGLPASIPSLTAAATFGFSRAVMIAYFGANLGALIGFLISRHLARDWFTEIVGKRMALAQINRAVAESGWKIVMITRLPPISPFSIVNYAYGLTPVTLGEFLIGTAIGIIPGTMAYIYLGTILGDVAQANHRERTAAEWAIYILGFIATIAVCIYLVRAAKSALARHAIAE
jgi:uncharacterized membrane protein YdjX (TVP38/TMEM64 family)